MVTVQFFKLLIVLPAVRSCHGAHQLSHGFKGESTLLMPNMNEKIKLQSGFGNQNSPMTSSAGV